MNTKYNHNAPHLALIEFINQAAEEQRWEIVFVKHYKDNQTYAEYLRDHVYDNQRLKYVLKNGKISMIKTAGDGLWYDAASVYNLTDPDSLESIKSYFIY